jgi:hypothetical protein
MEGEGRELQAFDSELEKPGNQQGAGVGCKEEQASKDIGPELNAKIAV